jgi:hypothetical protein
VEELVDSGPVRRAAPKERAGSSPAWQAEDEIINLECFLSSVGLEHCPYKAGVVGSNPTGSTSSPELR